MGRRRLRQRQSARLYYKEHDHRDMILDDEYLNAIYPSDHQYEPCWRKYKKFSLIVADTWFQPQWFSIDVVNKFVSFSIYMSHPETYAFGSAFAVVGGYISKNGYDFKYARNLPSSTGYSYRFARRYPFELMNYYSQRKVTVSYYDFDWNTDQHYAGGHTINTIEHTFETWHNDLTPVGEATDGIFAYRFWQERVGTSYPWQYHKYYELYRITNSGFSLVYDEDWIDTTNGMNRAEPQYIRYHNGKYCGIYSYRNNTEWGVRLWTSSDGDTWTAVDLIPAEPPTSGMAMRVVPVYRGNTWYFYVERNWNYQQYYKWLLYTSTDLSTFTQVALPDYLDIPVLGYEDGIHGDIDDDSDKTVRVKINTYDGNIPADDEDTLPMRLWQGTYENIISAPSQEYSVNDGHINIDPPTEFVIGVTGDYDTWDEQGYVQCYFIDNMELQTSSGNFAFVHSTTLQSAEAQENHEFISPTDYIFGGNNNG